MPNRLPNTLAVFCLTNVTRDMKRKRFTSHLLRLYRDLSPGVFFVTKCVQPKRAVLGKKEQSLVVSSLKLFVRRGDVQLAAFVVMLDHFHVMVEILGDSTVGKWMRCIMSFVAARTADQFRVHRCHWQEGFYETRVKSEKQFWYVVDYIHANPVRSGLVERPEQWPASSARSPEWVRLTW